MTEEEARAWIGERYGVPRETALARYAELLRTKSEEQNLISRSTLPQLWARHLVDSAQLLPLAATASGSWIDIGSGAGLPGIVVAILEERPVTLVEPRARRAQFLSEVVDVLGLGNVTVAQQRIEVHRPAQPAAVISARAVGALADVLGGAVHCAAHNTIWVLPKGRNGHSEVVEARKAWQGSFHVEQSITEPESLIVIARNIRPK